MVRGFSILVTFLIVCASFAQAPLRKSVNVTTSLPIFNDSTEWTDAKKATVLAMVLPGAGQIYNKKYWKAGLVYGGAVGVFYMYKYNADSLKAYQTEYTARLNNDTISYRNVSTQSVKNFRDLHRRFRDISILSFAGLYALQIIDANVDAHLKEFRVNKDLSINLRPEIYAIRPGIGSYSGASITLNF